MKQIVKIGMIGFGQRGTNLLKDALLPMKDVVFCGVCDAYADRAEAAADMVEKETGVRPFSTTDYRQIVSMDVDAIIIASAWESHIQIAIDAMKAGKYVGMEVGGAYCLEDCWKLVDTSEQTGMPCMLMENCCYGKRELMVLNMVKKGLFGEVVACEGGYCHDLREEVSSGEEIRHYRLRNYLHRNCENYPTHELGPICKVLNVNNGNRLLSLSSFASPARGLHEYAVKTRGTDSKLAKAEFRQGDIVKTVITCANGELITLTLDTTLPRAYSRRFSVRGTKAGYWEDLRGFFFDGIHNEEAEWDGSKLWGNEKDYEQEHLHPLWRAHDTTGGHGGMDPLVFGAFIDAVRNGTQTPIDVYDAATWMAVSCLSEQSIALGGQPQAFPDFTRGKWMERHDKVESPYSLD